MPAAVMIVGDQRVAKLPAPAAEYLDRGYVQYHGAMNPSICTAMTHDRLVLNEQAEEEAAGHHEQQRR